jgi:predicted nucleic-acid-binding protein
MIGLDTNVLVRFLVRDDEAQFERARRLIRREAAAGEPVLISLVVILETEWVLRSRYDLTKAEILTAFSGLLESVEVTFEDETSLEQALFLWKDTNVQFADCLIGARHAILSCQGTATFDTKALRIPGFIAA